MKGKLIVTGHPYAFPHYLKVFSYAPSENFIFALPRVWKSKTTLQLEKRSGMTLYRLHALSYGKQSFFGGLWKGWLPALELLLPYLKFKQGARVLYSCSEPNLLTTLSNGLAAKLWGLRYVIFTWQNVAPKQRLSGWKLRWSNALVKLNLRLADGVICGNQAAEKLVKLFRPELKTIVCPLSGVDVEKFIPGHSSVWREKLGLADEPLILFYGALDKRKGLNVLLSAFKNLSNSSKLVIVGKGPERANLEKQVVDLELAQRVSFIDWLPNDQLPALLNAADIFVYPSVPAGGWEEQFGYAMAEASASGLPVVATQTGSIAEVVLPEKTGILVEPNNANALRSALERLLGDPVLRHAMGRAGRDFISSNFSHKKVAEKLYIFLNNFI
ncbi:MAG TPA: glycosyltransferase family 4 protein [Candidatus Paceibacterota bacterium]|nr:glycosyltransferase family 4 protein [Candidatus Paceibacterota bacterium]